MGFFSFKISGTGNSISNSCSLRGAHPCKMYLPDGRVVEEREYEGFGVFGGLDFFVEIARANRKIAQEKLGDIDMDAPENEEDVRGAGISIFYMEDPAERIYFPRFSEIDYKGSWLYLQDPESCPNQGYFFDDDGWEEDEDDYEDEFYE